MRPLNSTPQWKPPLAAALFAALIGFTAPLGRVAADDDQATETQSEETSPFARTVQSAAQTMEVRRSDADDADAYRLRRQPLMTYSDPARICLAAALWRFGAEGRPKGLAAIELWPRDESSMALLSHEFLSFTEQRFEVTSKFNPSWHADASALKAVELPDAAEPAMSENRRLLQMKQLARRFSASQRLDAQTYRLRLMPSPIDRYASPKDGIVDGALFAFVYGTNPELIVLLECDEKRWECHVARMSSAELFLERDGREVLKFAAVKPYQGTGAYVSRAYDVKRPPSE